MRTLKIFSVGFLLIPLLLSAIGSDYQEQHPLQNNEVEFSFFALESGEAMLIHTGRGKNFLINTGAKSSENELIKKLNAMGIKDIDTLILTNQSPGTCGNTERILNRYHVGKLFYANEMESFCMKNKPNFVKKSQWKRGELHELSPGLDIRVLPTFVKGEMSLFIRYGKTSILFLANGDIRTEDKLINSYPMEAEIVKIANYAQTKSPTMKLLDKIDPQIAIIYTQKGIQANEGLLERLNESWIDVYHLKYVGTTIIRCNLQDYEVLNEES